MVLTYEEFWNGQGLKYYAPMAVPYQEHPMRDSSTVWLDLDEKDAARVFVDCEPCW